MRPEDGDLARVWDIVQWGDRLARLIRAVTWEAYSHDEQNQIAVERCIEVIGESARHLSDDFKQRHADVPWRDIIQQRNIIAHGYFRLDHARLWHVATVEAPRLIDRLAPLVSDPPAGP